MSVSLGLQLKRTLRLRNCSILCGRYSSTQNTTTQEAVDITSAEETPIYIENEKINNEEIMMKRNKSRLNVADRNRLFGLPPYNKQNLTWFHETIRYKQRQFGRYGIAGLDVTVGALWPTEEGIEDKIAYEKAGNPHTIQENWKLIAERNNQRLEWMKRRDEDVAQKMEKVEQWKKDFHAKIAKKQADILAAKEKRERLVEEVRRQFGFKIDPRDDRFKAALEKKEKEDRKRKKEAKKQERSAKYMAYLLSQSNINKPTDKSTEINVEKKE